MIYTYSVIIQNKKSTEAFLRFHPIFKEALDNNRIGVCKWNESGTTIDTAVPELRELTDDKEAWRAYIIRYEDDDLMSDYQTDSQNPYDFVINREEKEDLIESEVPLIRLTHMLGEIPQPEMKFVPETIMTEGKAPRVIYKPVKDVKQEELYDKLTKQYQFDGIRPVSIVLITVRKGFDKSVNTDRAWQSNRGSKRADFWKRNFYPASTRFLVYDFEQKGPIQREADEFGFWNSVMLLTSNELETGVLQAYKLYNLRTQFDKKQMAESFLETAGRLKSARYVIDRQIRRDIESKLTVESRIPEYQIEVPVVYQLPEDKDRTINIGQFGFMSKELGTELDAWEKEKKNAEDWLDESVRKVERALDMTASRMRECCTFSEYEVSKLDEYQEEDMIRETDLLYREIVDLQGELPLGRVSENQELEYSAAAVYEYLRGRVTIGNALVSMGFVFLLVVLGQIPAIVNYKNNGVGSMGLIMASIVAEWGIILVFAFIVLLIQFIIAKGLLKDYKNLIQMAFSRLSSETQLFSDYISKIASHSRGHSYMNLSNRKKHYAENEHFLKHRHIKSINIFWGQIKAWSTAYHLPINFDEIEINENTIVDTSVSPLQSPMYTFEVEQSYLVEVNKSGYMISSPFSFAERIEITKEELYDDDEGVL